MKIARWVGVTGSVALVGAGLVTALVLNTDLPAPVASATAPAGQPVPTDDTVQRALRAGKPTVAEFGANACAPCREMKPVLQALQQRLAASGLWGAVLLGGLIGTVMSPCATPALAAALALAGSGSAWGVSVWWGAALLLSYGIGHSLLLGVAGTMPGVAAALMRRFASATPWLPGRRAFAVLLAAAGLWWVGFGLGA